MPPRTKPPPLSPEAQAIKQLKILTSTLNRNVKDINFYKHEVVKEQERYVKIEAADPDKCKQQNQVIDEAKMMIPEAQGRITAALKSLNEYLEAEKELLPAHPPKKAEDGTEEAVNVDMAAAAAAIDEAEKIIKETE